ncbi:MAG: fibronectin type III domain-containing protein, partial [bacterium]|nr:fibronectin type III domain-containing protein [bacterium]
AGKKYYFQVSSTDLSGNGPTANEGELSFATREVADEKAPVVFSRPIALGITHNSAIINWGADEPHSAVIRYRKATAPKQAGSGTFTDSKDDINQTRSHAVTLDGLDLGTAYEYEVETIDADGNTSTSKNLRFTTAATEDTTPPTIVRGPVVRNIRTTSVTIDWFTDEPADSRVSYGLTTNYTEIIEDVTGSRLHSVTLTDLTPGTLYHYAVGSADQSGNVVTTDISGTVLGLSKDHTFSTPGQQQTNLPIFLEGPFVEFTNEIVIVKWKTDQLSTSSVIIGVAPGSSVPAGTPVFGENSQFVVENNDLVDNHIVTITGLTPASGYLFQASSTNASGLTASSNDPTTPRKLQPPGGFGSFTTNTEADSQFPVITGGPTIVASTTNTLTVEWQTDESSNSVIQFGGSATSLTNEEVDGTNVTTHRAVLTKLAPGATYAYKVASTDATGNGATESQTAFGTTPSESDLTAPVITSINNTASPSEPIYKTDRSAAIRWVTNEAASASVAFGTAADNLSDVRSLSDFNTEHNVTLTNLQPSTTYFYQISSSDQNNNGPAKSTVAQFTTDAQPDGTAPQITAGSVKASAGDKTATITWETDELSDSAVEYGLSGGSLGFNVGDASDITKHSVTLTNLTPGTEYSFIVKSFDRSNNESAAIDPITFTTFAEGQTPAPEAPAKPTATGGNASVRLSWDASTSTGITGYLVQRAATGGEYSSITSLGATTSYVDATVQNGTAYTYRVVALGAQQAQSTPSTASDEITPGADKGPAAPTFSHIQGNRLTPTLVINNASGENLSYVFQLSTSAEFTDAVAIASGLAPGAGLGSSDPSGVTAWTVDRTLTEGTTYHYRVKSGDGTFDSAYLTGNFTAKASTPEYIGDISGDKKVNLSDFIRFAQSFGKEPGQDGYNALADITGDSKVNLADFIQFAQSFGKTYIQGTSSGKLVAPAVLTYGINTHAQLQLVGRPVSSEQGAIFTVDAKISNAENLQGYALRIQYDPSTLRFKSASNGKDNLLEQDGRLAELFGTLSHDPLKGEILLASTVTYGAPAEGEGLLARLRFDLLQEHPQGNLAHIAEGILIDGRFNADLAQNLGGRLSLVPDAFALEHNYPNPFNPETTIRYAVPEAGKVTLRIYNVLGQEVATLVNTNQVAGYYSVQWNGMDRLGRSVASGVYLYRMEAQNFTRVHKMLLLK